MKVMLGQINTTPRDFTGNVAKIKAGIEKALTENCDLIVFPELSIPGYLTRDLMYSQDYVTKNLQCLHQIAALTQTSKLTVVVGYIDANHEVPGKKFRNMVGVIKGGLLIACYQKQLLPFYDVFDEGRYFAPGDNPIIVEICGQKYGLLCCEDIFNDKDMDDYNYHNNPYEAYRKLGIKHFIAINSSPFVQNKPAARIDMVKKSSKGGATIIYVNQVGGQDELVFDGNSFIVHDGELCYKEVAFQETMNAVCLPMHAMDYHVDSTSDVHDALVLGLRDYINKSGFKSVVVGSSGGIDSAVVLALACEAIGPENVHAIRMPSIYSSEGSKDDAFNLHQNLGCNDYLVPIEHETWLTHINKSLSPVIVSDVRLFPYNKVADENLQARMRGQIVMHFSNAFGILPLTTGNKTELALGYCTLYGDMNGGFAPINDLYKLEVYALARHINKVADGDLIPRSIIDKAPSAELAPGQTDEASLLPYAILDPIVKAYIEHYIGTFEGFCEHLNPTQDNMHFYNQAGYILTREHTNKMPIQIEVWADRSGAKADYEKMINLIDKSEFKRRQAAPGIKISKVAFGSGRRLPICKGTM